MPGTQELYTQLSQEDFFKARQRELVQRIVRLFNPGSEELLSLQDVKKILKPRGETYRGMQTVDINLIVGSEGRFNDFNQAFLPKYDYLKTRWTSIDRAHYQDVILPPIRLYEIGGVYFVRDGNHRVSVARSRGVSMIDAEVTSLNSEIRLSPGMGPEDVAKAVIRYEKDLFYDETYFGLITDFYDLDFSSLGQYDVVYNHILVHKYYLNESEEREISLKRAIKSWYDKVFKPIYDVILSEGLLSLFPGRTASDLYVYMVKYWDSLKTCCGVEVPAEEAVKRYAEAYGTRPRWLLSRLWNRILRALKSLVRTMRSG